MNGCWPIEVVSSQLSYCPTPNQSYLCPRRGVSARALPKRRPQARRCSSLLGIGPSELLIYVGEQLPSSSEEEVSGSDWRSPGG